MKIEKDLRFVLMRVGSVPILSTRGADVLGASPIAGLEMIHSNLAQAGVLSVLQIRGNLLLGKSDVGPHSQCGRRGFAAILR